MKHFIYLLLLLPLVLCLKCKDEPEKPKPAPKPTQEELPPETTEGKQTFGCLVNGKVWRNTQNPNPLGHSYLKASYANGVIYVAAIRNKDEKQEGMAVHILKDFYSSTNVYQLNDNIRFPGFVNSICDYTYIDYHTGTLEITRFDTINYIVSGRFEFTVAKEGCDTIRVTDGRFDLKYGY